MDRRGLCRAAVPARPRDSPGLLQTHWFGYKCSMSIKGKKLLSEALQLAPKEREALASQLFDSLEASDPDEEAAWQAEIERRIRELDSGKVKTIPWAS